MIEINKCLKEWNTTIEALGQGKQTILIRNYGTNVKQFLLYPTVSYASKDNYLESFQDIHHKFVEENTLPMKKDDKVLIKYFATVEKIIETPISRVPGTKYYIWTRDHVKSYMTRKNAYIWVLRVYKLKEPHWAEPTTGAIRFANLKEEICLDGIKPVLDVKDFTNVFKSL